MKGEVPVAIVSIDTNRKDPDDQRLMFDTVQFKVIQKVDANDVKFQGGITAEDSDDYETSGI